MPKKIRSHAFTYRFLAAAEALDMVAAAGSGATWDEFVESLDFAYVKGGIGITSSLNSAVSMVVDGRKAVFYLRGDSVPAIRKQEEMGLMTPEDRVQADNGVYFDRLVREIAATAGFEPAASDAGRIAAEREFHDAWAEGEDLSQIDVRQSNEVCTAPEMRYIVRRLGDIRGKRVLDVGCGLGEASVYFAMLGADVTASDLSPGMLAAASELARTNCVKITPHVASAEDMGLAENARFDVIYTGNLLHHVNIQEMLDQVLPHLAKDGVFVSWDPLAYNPAINVYRNRATEVRTEDEHPLTRDDIRGIGGKFDQIETKFFWLTTLVIFVIMAVIQRRDPNKVRFWKAILKDGPKWAWLYRPLEALDRVVLTLVPPLRWLCWNVVVIARRPRKS
jgi:SAM-dependent methyltransferase